MVSFKGKVVEVTMDIIRSTTMPVTCKLYGIVMSETKETITLVTYVLSGVDEKTTLENMEGQTIEKSQIKHIEVFV